MNLTKDIKNTLAQLRKVLFKKTLHFFKKIKVLLIKDY